MDFHPPQTKSLLLRTLTAVALFCVVPVSVCQAPPSSQEEALSKSGSRIASLIDSLHQVRSPTSVAISPDGNNLVWTVTAARRSELHLTSLALAGSAQDGAGERVISPDTIGDVTNHNPGICTASHPAWSPDGKQLAFLSDCSSTEEKWQSTSQNNVFVWTPAANGIKQVSHLHGSINSIAWSPDGKSIGFLYVENATRSAGALDAMKPWSGVIGEEGVEVQQVWATYPATGTSEPLTRRELHVYEFSWSPDSQSIVYVGNRPPGEDNWWTAQLRLISLVRNENQPERVLFDPAGTSNSLHGLQIAVPRFSPDGKQIAFIGGLMSDQGSTGGDIYVMPSSGGEPKDITTNRPSSPAYIQWLTDRYLGVSEHVGGSSHITAIDVNTGKDFSMVNLTLPETIISGVDVMSISIAPKSRRIALIRQSFDHPPEVWAGAINDLKQITHLNDAIKPAWGKAESIDYTNDGFHIQGWLLYPANYDPAKKYPLIVSVHGGPSSAVTPRWPTAVYGATPFSALGYFVFMPNPRGSYGQGEKFTQANIKDFGYGDLRDVLAGMDVLEKRYPIDKDREGLTGWSYGGFMTMFGVTQTSRFKAAVAGAGISNWQSYYGENSIDQWMVPFFGKSVYEDPAVYAKSSAINYINKVKTPTLVVVGDRDGECPAPQSFEFWHALKAEGVKTQLVIYPNEGHHFVDPSHQRDVLKRALDWFEAEMPAK